MDTVQHGKKHSKLACSSKPHLASNQPECTLAALEHNGMLAELQPRWLDTADAGTLSIWNTQQQHVTADSCAAPNALCSAVQGAPEEWWEGDHVVDLVGEVAATGSDDDISTRSNSCIRQSHKASRMLAKTDVATQYSTCSLASM